MSLKVLRFLAVMLTGVAMAALGDGSVRGS